MKMMKSLKSLKGMKALKNENALLLLGLLVAIFMADRLKPLVNNMVGKLTLVLAVCYLAKQDLMLGLLGALLYISLNNGLIEGFKEGDDPTDKDEIVDEGFKEGDSHEEEEEAPPPLEGKEEFQEGEEEEEDAAGAP